LLLYLFLLNVTLPHHSQKQVVGHGNVLELFGFVIRKYLKNNKWRATLFKIFCDDV